MSLCSVRRLSAGYGDFKVLFDVDLEIDEGQAAAIIGANGAGKTTLLRSITGLLRAPDDSINFAGRPIAGIPPHGRHLLIRNAARLDGHQTSLPVDSAGVAKGVKHQSAADEFEISFQNLSSQTQQLHSIRSRTQCSQLQHCSLIPTAHFIYRH